MILIINFHRSLKHLGVSNVQIYTLLKWGGVEVKTIREITCRTVCVKWVILIIITSALALSGCTQKLEGSSNKKINHSMERTKELPAPSFLGEEIVPIDISEQEEFYKSAGWLSESEILYITNKGGFFK